MKILNTSEAAKKLGISPARVRDLISKGRIPAQRVSRDFIILEEDLVRVKIRKLGKPGKDVARKMILSYWDTMREGELILDFKSMERDRARTRARHDIPAIIVKGNRKIFVEDNESLSIEGKRVAAVEASPYRFGTSFLGSLLFAPSLLAHHKPLAPVEVVGIVGEEDADLSLVLDELVPKEIGKNITIESGNVSYGSPYSKMNKFERERIESYWQEVKGILIEKQVVAVSTTSKGHPIQGVILQNKRFTKIRRLDTLRGYPGKIRIVHATPRRLNIPIIGRAIGAYYLMRLAYKVEVAESIILCKSNDTELARILKEHYQFVTIKPETE